MKSDFIAVFFLFYGLVATGQAPKKVHSSPEDVETLSGIIASAYDGISGEAGTSRQLEKIKALYAPNAIIFKNTSIEGKPSREVLTVAEFYEGMGEVRESGFFEEEINREIRIFGTIAHVWSTYQVRHAKNGPVIRRGINSLQLHFKDNRWWILSWGWDGENEENKIPASFDSY
ncbi:hypothetical protein [Ulvibacterium sp.]|uniref:hypothetical protein n=1 Tax=Ulvibacterium sp. TaxID=2665914 RepID=UPI003BAA5F7C